MIEVKDINADTITLAIDCQGGLCDRLMKGRRGIVNNANASLESMKFNAPDDEDLQKIEKIEGLTDKDLYSAINILITDNFDVHVIDKTHVFDCVVVGKDLDTIKVDDRHLTVVDIDKIDFKDNIYMIF